MEMITLPIPDQSHFERKGIDQDSKYPFEEFDLLLAKRFLSEREGYGVVSFESLFALLENTIHLNDPVQDLYLNPVRVPEVLQQEGFPRALNPLFPQKEINSSLRQPPIEAEPCTGQAIGLSNRVNGASLISSLSEDPFSDIPPSVLISERIFPPSSIVEFDPQKDFRESSDPISSKGLSSQEGRASPAIKTQEDIFNFYFQSLFWEKEGGEEPLPPHELMSKNLSPNGHLHLTPENPSQFFIDKEPLISLKGLNNFNQGSGENSNEFIHQSFKEVSKSIEIPKVVQKLLSREGEGIEIDGLKEPSPIRAKESFFPNDKEEKTPQSFEFKMKTILRDESEMLTPLKETKGLYEDDGKGPFTNFKEYHPKEPLFNHSIESPKAILSSFKGMVHPPLSPPLKIDPFEIYQHISKQIIWSIRNNGERIKMALDPPQLGNLLLEIDRDKGNIRTTIWAENLVTKEILEHHQIQLEKILRDEGFRLEKFDVLLQQDMGTLRHREDAVEDRRQAQRRYKGESLHAPLVSLETPLQGTASFHWGSQYLDLFV